MPKIGPIQAKKLEIGEEEVKQKGLSGPGAPQHECVRAVAVVEIEKVRRVMIGLEDRQVFADLRFFGVVDEYVLETGGRIGLLM
jgi:hypothetical protein